MKHSHFLKFLLKIALETLASLMEFLTLAYVQVPKKFTVILQFLPFLDSL